MDSTAARPTQGPRRPPVPRRRFSTSRVFVDLAIGMVSLGLLAGVVFPFFVHALGVPGAHAFRPAFAAACLAAGFTVGACNYGLSKLVVGRRLRILSERLEEVAASVRQALVAAEGRAALEGVARIPVDSDDEIGDSAAAFNELLDAVEEMEGYRLLVNRSSDVIAVVDAGGAVRWLSPSVQRVLGYPPGAPEAADLFQLVHPEDVTAVRRVLVRLLAGPGGATATVTVRTRHADGTWRHLETVATNLLDERGVHGLVLHARDVGERVELEQQLRQQALHDALTGLANRLLFAERVSHALERRAAGPVAVLFCDLDDFKTINDGLGHAAGDLVLVEVARRLQGCLRAGDTVARLGGDEFAVLLEAPATEASAVEVAERILEALSLPVRVDAHDLATRATLGIALDRGTGTTAESLLRDADAAMYIGKSQGKGRHTTFAPAMHDDVLARLTLKADLAFALERQQLLLHYQPLIDLATGRPRGVEALVRWAHPERGVIAPADFIPLAEETGLIVPIGRWVLAQACLDARRWVTDRPDASFDVAVNISARQLDEPALVDHVLAALAASGVPAGQLTLEITETALTADSPEVTARLEQLRQLGVHLAVDDFGTGYSSLSYLQRLPVDTIKIDRSFVAELSGETPPLVQAVVELARTLGLDTIAEGIEDDAQLAWLQGLDCRLGQGFLFSPPVSADEVGALLRRGELGPARPACAA